MIEAKSSRAVTPILRSLDIQRRVIGALVMREIITRFGRHNIGFMWLFVEPMLFTLGITALWTFTKAVHGSQLPIVAFAVTGYSSVLLWRNSANRCAKAIEPNLSLLYHRNVRVFDLFASRLVLEVAGGTISLVAISLVFIALGWMAMPVDVLVMVNAWLLLSGLAVGMGLVVGALSEMSEILERIWHALTYLLFPLSGAVFMVDWLPSAVREMVLWLPMVHGVEMLRHGYFGGVVRTHENVPFLATADLVLILLGLFLVSICARKVEPQ
jgi:capsular polysaccharide transport system permease protein